MKINMNGKKSSILLVLLHQVEYAPNSQTAFSQRLARTSEKHSTYLFTHTCMTSVTSPYRSVPGTRRKYTDIAVENVRCRHFTHARALGPLNIYTRTSLSLEQYLITDVCIWWQTKWKRISFKSRKANRLYRETLRLVSNTSRDRSRRLQQTADNRRTEEKHH